MSEDLRGTLCPDRLNRVYGLETLHLFLAKQFVPETRLVDTNVASLAPLVV